jgi:nucleoside-diphosphate-sugar epimerase
LGSHVSLVNEIFGFIICNASRWHLNWRGLYNKINFHIKDMRMKKIIVTGGCGFIGNEVVRQLLRKNYEVTVVDNLSKPRSYVKEGYEFIKIDLTNKERTNKIFKSFDICIHLAARIGGIAYLHKYPATVLSENDRINSNVFEASAENGLERIVYVSSSMVFESANTFPSKESDIFSIPPPLTAYGFSKLVGEYYCRAFNKEFCLDYVICRPFNAYGVNEYPEKEPGHAHVIPDLIKKVLSGQYPLEILGDGEQTRCFTHVKDVASGIIAAMESEKAKNEDFNIGNDRETKIIDLAKMIYEKCGVKKPFKAKFVKGFEHDIQRRIPDVSKAKRLLGWEAKIGLEQGLDEVIGWLRNRLKK